MVFQGQRFQQLAPNLTCQDLLQARACLQDILSNLRRRHRYCVLLRSLALGVPDGIPGAKMGKFANQKWMVQGTPFMDVWKNAPIYVYMTFIYTISINVYILN